MFFQPELPLSLPTSLSDRPSVDNITVPFEWERVDYLLGIPSVDFGKQGLKTEYNRDIKRSDLGYQGRKPAR
jgi:hypothetical protein